MPSRATKAGGGVRGYTSDYRGRRIAIRCGFQTRHWFSVHGRVGLRSPVCRWCGAPNPKPLSEDEQREYEAVMGKVGSR